MVVEGARATRLEVPSCEALRALLDVGSVEDVWVPTAPLPLPSGGLNRGWETEWIEGVKIISTVWGWDINFVSRL